MSDGRRTPEDRGRTRAGRPDRGAGITLRRCAASVAVTLLCAAAASAQQPRPLTPGARLPTVPGAENPHGPTATGLRRVDGRVVRLTRTGPVGVGGHWVTLHRVGPDAQAPVDSLRAGRDGGYHFTYRATGSDRAIYFVTATYDGIAYFTPPLKGMLVRGDPATITVFDTTSRNLPLAVRGRHVVISALDTAQHRRTVLEVIELSNDSTRTLVGTDSTTPTWSSALPGAARDVRMEQGDVPAAAMTIAPGRLRILAPFAPGVKQFSFSYRLPDEAFPLTVPVERPTAVVEVLVEDPSAKVRGVQIVEVNPVSFDGRPFKRFLAQDAPATGTLVIDIPPAPGNARMLPLLAIVAAVGVAMLVALVSATMRRGGAHARDASHADDPERLAREIADLDTALERHGGPDDRARAEFRAARAALKVRLTVALARHAGDA